MAGAQPGNASPAPDRGPEVPESTERLIEAAYSAVMTMDAAGRVVRFNPAAEVMFGYSRDEAVGRQFAELVVAPTRQEAHWATLIKLASGDDEGLLDRRIVQRALRKGGEEFPVEWTL